jgi:hypothetical protein
MSTSTDKQDVSGRSWDQITRNGTSSAGSMGVGGTGDSGKLDRQGEGKQSASRTDDLLTDGSDLDTGSEGFARSGGQVQTGMEGMNRKSGAGNRQSAGQSRGQSGGLNQQGTNGMRTTETERDEGNSARE